MEADGKPPSTECSTDGSNVPGKMFVGGLSWQTTGDGLRDYFSKYGEIKECLVMKDPTTQRSRGFGFVTFADPASVESVIKETHVLDEKKIDPKVAVPRRPQPKMVTKTKKVFIGGLSSNTTEVDMKKHFEEFGKVVETQLLFDKITQRHRGFGFVTYETEESADEACEEPFHIINEKKVEVKKAQPKEVMLSIQGGRARGRGYPGRGALYPFPPGMGRGAFPFGGFGSGFSYSPILGYNAASAAAIFSGRGGRGAGGGGRRGYVPGGYAGMMAGFPGPYQNQFMNPGPDQRRQYYADYANISSQGSGRGGGSRPEVAPINQALSEYPDHYAAGSVTMNNFAHQGFGPPPSPVSRYAAARSPGPLPGVGQDLTSYMSTGASGTESLSYTATSPQSTGFAHTMF